MKTSLRTVAFWAAALCAVAAAMGGCATAPSSDGGIVGTGNRPDCEAAARKNADPASLPPECRQEKRR
jgi:hypothetical protein